MRLCPGIGGGVGVLGSGRVYDMYIYIYVNLHNIYIYQGGEVDASEVEGGVGAATLVAHVLVGVHDDGALWVDCILYIIW